MKTNDATQLEWVRIFDPIHIPTYLVEQIKHRNFTVDRFYKYQKALCLTQAGEGFVLNPMNLLWVLVDEKRTTKGFCWFTIDALGNSLVINTFSIDKDYWNNGQAVKALELKAIEIQQGAKLDRVYWMTRCPKHSEKFGFKKSKQVLMEYSYGRHNDGGGCETSGESQLDESRTTEISTDDIRGSGSTVDERLRVVA